jgi:hypothetical protein
MAIYAVIGYAQSLSGREAATQATHNALEKVGKTPIVFGLIISSIHHPVQQILNGTSSILADAPLFGLSTISEITPTGVNQRSAVVALFTGDGFDVRSDWFSGFSEDSLGTSQKMTQALQINHSTGSLLVAVDGISGDANQLCTSLPEGQYPLAGCLAGGSQHLARTYQIGGRQCGFGGLAAASITGKLTIGVGYGHGWQPVGKYFTITQSRGPWVYTLDNRPVAEVYTDLFHYPTNEWSTAPLNEFVRLYPLGIEQKNQDSLLIRSPLRIEPDGSLRMQTVIPEGAKGHLLIGSIENCLEAARNATKQALLTLGSARPVLALVFVDVAWQMLFEAQAGREFQPIMDILGKDVPLIGGYTYGQIARTYQNGSTKGTPEFLNQHIQVVVFGETE